MAVTADVADLAQLEIWGDIDCQGSPQIESLEGIEQLIALTRLVLPNHGELDITPLGKLQNLAHLDLEYIRVNDFSSLGSLEFLVYLRVEINSPATDLSPISQIDSLEELHIYASVNQLDISPLFSLDGLHTLEIKGDYRYRGWMYEADRPPRSNDRILALDIDLLGEMSSLWCESFGF